MYAGGLAPSVLVRIAVQAVGMSLITSLRRVEINLIGRNASHANIPHRGEEGCGVVEQGRVRGEHRVFRAARGVYIPVGTRVGKSRWGGSLVSRPLAIRPVLKLSSSANLDTARGRYWKAGPGHRPNREGPNPLGKKCRVPWGFPPSDITHALAIWNIKRRLLAIKSQPHLPFSAHTCHLPVRKSAYKASTVALSRTVAPSVFLTTCSWRVFELSLGAIEGLASSVQVTRRSFKTPCPDRG